MSDFNFLKENAEFFLRLAFKPYFRKLFLRLTHPNRILRIKLSRLRVKTAKISSAIIYYATIYDHKNIPPLRYSQGKTTVK